MYKYANICSFSDTTATKWHICWQSMHACYAHGMAILTLILTVTKFASANLPIHNLPFSQQISRSRAQAFLLARRAWAKWFCRNMVTVVM